MIVALAALIAFAPACGGDDESNSSDRPSTTRSGASTTTAERNKADTATAELAKTAAILATDYPEGWKVQTEAATRPVSDNHCEYTEDGPYASLPDGAVQNGPTMQLGDDPGFVTSRVFVFPDDAAASAFITTLNTPAWETCQLKALNDFQKKQSTEQEARMQTREAEGLGTDRFESYAQIRFVDPAAPDDTTGTYEASTFRFGRVVIMVSVEQQFLEPAVQTTFDAQRREALVKQFARVDAATAGG